MRRTRSDPDGSSKRAGHAATAGQSRASKAGLDKQYRLLFERNPQPMWVCDQETLAFLAVNEAAVRQYGYSREEFQRMTIKDIRPPDEVPRLLDHIARTPDPDPGPDDVGIWKHCKKDGTLFDVEITASRVSFDGRSARLILANDVTEQLRAASMQSQFAAIVESTDDGIIGKTLDGTITSWNAGAERIYGYSAEEVLGKPISMLVPPDRVDDLPLILERIRRTEQVAHFDTVRVTKSGKRIDVSITASPIRDAAGKTVGASTVVRDISEQKRREERLRQSEERYRRIVETANEGIWVIDADSNTTFVNQRVTDLLGYAGDEIEGKSVFAFLDEEGRNSGAIYLRQLQQGESVQVDLKVLHKNGTERWMLVVANPLLDKDGRYAGALGMITDITERKQAEEAAQRYTERLSLLRQIEQGILRAESPEAVATVVLDYLQKLAPLEYASIALMDYEAKEVHEIAVYKRGERTPGTRTPFAAVGSAMEKAEVTRRGEIFIMDTATYAKESPVIRGVFENGVRYIANVPLLAQGELIGALCLGASTGEGLPAEVLDLAQETAAPLAIAIQQARLFDAERQRSGELSRSNTLIASLARMAVRVQKSLDPQQVMETLGAELKSLEIDSVVALSEPQEFALSVRYVSFDRTVVELLERLTGEPMHGFRVPRERVPVYGELVRRKEPLYVRDVIPLAEASLSHLPSALIERTIELIGLVQGSSVILLPLTVEDRVLGFLAVVGKDLREDAVPAFSIFASQVAICLENARLFEELRVAQNSLGSLSRQLVEAHETERRTLARELHDEIGQLLTGLNLSLEACLRSDGDGIKARLSKGLALSSELLGRVRDLSLALRPAMLDDLGLVPTLLWHFEQFTGQTGVRVAFERSHLEGRLDPKIETAAYRIIQEALTNVARHAKVHEATVRLWADEQVMGMQIQDHGLGFDAQSVLSRCTTSGLIGMRERTTALGGHLVVESRPGTGTCVTAELPHDEGHQPIDEGEP